MHQLFHMTSPDLPKLPFSLYPIRRPRRTSKVIIPDPILKQNDHFYLLQGSRNQELSKWGAWLKGWLARYAEADLCLVVRIIGLIFCEPELEDQEIENICKSLQKVEVSEQKPQKSLFPLHGLLFAPIEKWALYIQD